MILDCKVRNDFCCPCGGMLILCVEGCEINDIPKQKHSWKHHIYMQCLCCKEVFHVAGIEDSSGIELYEGIG